MSEKQNESRTRLIRLIRRISKEEAWEIVDEYFRDYKQTTPTEDNYLKRQRRIQKQNFFKLIQFSIN